MIKIFFLCRRHPALTHEQYARFVLEGHAPLALEHHRTMCGYVINVADATPPDGPAYDSLPALSWPTLEDYRERLYDSPEGREIIRRDTARFMGGADAYHVDELVHRARRAKVPPGTATPGRKWIVALERRTDLDRGTFARAWREDFAPAAARSIPGLARYASNVVRERLSPTGEDWDGFAEILVSSDAVSPPPEALEPLARIATRRAVYPVTEYVQK